MTIENNGNCFLRCSLDSFTYGRDGEVVQNTPVNLNLCKGIKKSKFAWYPDNIGRPSILFMGCDIEWAYKNEEDRDKDYEALCYPINQ
jgi:hypothetical protein